MPKNKYPLPRFSVDRPVTVTMSLVSLLVVGYIAYTRIPLMLIPEGLDFPQLFVWTAYPNAGAVEVDGAALPDRARQALPAPAVDGRLEAVPAPVVGSCLPGPSAGRRAGRRGWGEPQ